MSGNGDRLLLLVDGGLRGLVFVRPMDLARLTFRPVSFCYAFGSFFQGTRWGEYLGVLVFGERVRRARQGSKGQL